jgi:metal-responsive CopG/Arc/MetJ family transcriptional regulator
VSNRLFYDPDTERPYIGLRLPAEQLSALDAARIKLRQSRSEFARQAINAYLQQIKAAGAN